MKATLDDCRNTFKIGYDAFFDSRQEAEEVRNMYHNRHYTQAQLAELASRGQPHETFNVIKLFCRLLLGYYSSIVNTVSVRPRNPRDIITATVLNDIINYIFEENRFDIEGDQIKLNGFLSGLLVAYVEVVDTEEKDEFGNIVKKIVSHHVPDSEMVFDPDSILDDYSDAKYIHRFKWLREADIKKTFGKHAADKLQEYMNHLNIDEAEFDYRAYSSANSEYAHQHSGRGGFYGHYRLYNQYLIVHTVIEDENGKIWSIYWHDNIELHREEFTYKIAKFPYRVQKLHSSEKAEYYGVFREIVESQKAINQALIQVQLMANSSKVFVEETSVDDLETFKVAVNRVNSIIPVMRLSGIRVQEMTREIIDQYTIIDKALDRIQRILGVNDSFLGMAYASDSGRKVKLQKGATIMSLRYFTARIEAFYKSLAEDIANLVKQYYKAHQVLRVTDAESGQRWVELNKPIEEFSGSYDEMGQPIMQPVLMISRNPANQEIEEDEDGNILMEPIPTEETDIEFTEFNIKIESVAYDDDDEKSQMMLDSVMSGQIGQMLAQVNPAGFFEIASLAMNTMSTKHSPKISEILRQTGSMLSQSMQAQQEASYMAQGAKGRSGSAPTAQ